jgi:hypothetical protein
VIRVVAEHAANLFAILGIFPETELTPTLTIKGRTYYRACSKEHYVLYRAAISGHGVPLHQAQR